MNGEFNLKDHIGESDYSKIEIKKGNIGVSINGEAKEITTKKGGMLNLNSEEFVIYPIKYSSHASSNSRQHTSSLVIDSTIYYIENPNFVGLDLDQKLYVDNAIKEYSANGVKRMKTGVIAKTDFFAEEAWDFDIDEEIPEEIKVTRNRNSGDVLEHKSKLMSGPMFQVIAILSEEYKTIDLRVPEVIEDKEEIDWVLLRSPWLL